ncbi:MAG: FKBP-type peptidyl-prolyl cis-trans isomerase [Acidobacteriaceae bacterium]
MKNHALPLSALVLAIAALPLGAQTHTVHHAVAHHTAEGGCVRVPELSPKIPALPANAPCARALYTLTHTPDIHLDYVSPLVTPELRAELSQEKTTYSLVYIDTLVGTGPLARPGKYYTVHYTGYLPDGTKFDSSVDRGKPITFPYGKHRVIEGWDTGFEGMHVGGKRRLYIPYQLAYGEAGRPPIIPAKSELIFDVEFIAQSDQMPNEQPPAMMHHTEPMHPATPPQSAKPSTPATKPQQ